MKNRIKVFIWLGVLVLYMWVVAFINDYLLQLNPKQWYSLPIVFQELIIGAYILFKAVNPIIDILHNNES